MGETGCIVSVEQHNVTISREPHGNRDHVRILDAGTGDVMASYWEERRSKPTGRPPGGKEARFVRLYQSNWVDIVREKRLSLTELGLLTALLAFVGWESNFLVNPDTGKNASVSDVSRLLGMDRSRVHEGLVALNKKGFIALLKLGDGRDNHVLFNSNVGLFGKRLKDKAEHDAFSDVPYKPKVVINHKE